VLALGGVALVTSAAGGTASAPGEPSYRAPALVHTGYAPMAVATKTKAVKGVMFGGLTGQHWPVVIRITANGSKVADAVAGIDASTDEYWLTLPDEFTNLPVKKGRFGMTWGPQKVDFGGGYIADCSGQVRGKFSSNRSKVSGIWSYRAVVHDPTGAIVATHDTGVVPWSARQ
jgi:hypothetical protein